MSDEESGLENLTEDSESIGDQGSIREGNFGNVVIDEAIEVTNAAGSGSSGSPPSADDQNESLGTRDNIKEEILACILRGLILAEEMTSSVTDIGKLLKYAKDLYCKGDCSFEKAASKSIGPLIGGKLRVYSKMWAMRTHRNFSYALIKATMRIMISWTTKIRVVDSVGSLGL